MLKNVLGCFDCTRLFVTDEMLVKYLDERMLKHTKSSKDQKVMIKEELLPIAWHPDACYDWCFSEVFQKARHLKSCGRVKNE